MSLDLLQAEDTMEQEKNYDQVINFVFYIACEYAVFFGLRKMQNILTSLNDVGERQYSFRK